jgi:hypothetical protein
MIEVKVAWSAIESHVLGLVNQIKKSKKKYNWIVSLNRGGLYAGVRLSHLMGIRHGVLSVESYSYKKKKDIRGDTVISMVGGFKNGDRVLLVDDIADSGDSLVFAAQRIRDLASNVGQIETATIHYKPKSIVEPNYFAEEVPNDVWVVYPWASLGETRKKKQDAGK